MKKLMLSAVVLLPLIILMILLVSGAVVGMITHVYVEALEFRQPETLVLVMDDESNPPSAQLQFNILPLSASNADVAFSSDDESIVKVDEKGTVTAVFYGETYVRVTSLENESAYALRRVRVTDSRVHALKFSDGYPSTIYVGETQQFTVSVLPYEADNKLVNWSSSDPSILAIASDGMATAHSYGDVTVTATAAENENIKVSVNVRCRNPLSGLYFASNEQYAVQTTDSLDAKFPTVYFSPAGAGEQLVYSSSDESVATVDDSGNITFVKAGRVTITASATDGLGNEAYISKDYISTDGHTIGDLFKKTEYTFDYDEFEFKNGKSVEDLGIKFNNPLGVKLEIKASQVEFSPSGIITFDENSQKFYLTGAGTAKDGVRIKIHAKKYKRGAVTEADDVCRVYVTRDIKEIKTPEKIEVNRRRVNLLLDGELIKFEPSNHTARISYSIESGSCATVDDNGLVKFTEAGTVNVKITASGSNQVTKTVPVTYTKKTDNKEKTLLYNAGDADHEDWSLYLDGDDAQIGVINFTAKSEETVVSYTILSGSDVIELDSSNRIIPKAGGYATISVTTREKDKNNLYNIPVYIDRAIEDISIEAREVSASEKIPYTVKIVPADAMAGKELKITIDGVTNTVSGANENGEYKFGDDLNFDYAATKTVTVRVWQNMSKGQVAIDGANAMKKIRSTCGELIEHPTVMVGNEALDANKQNQLIIDNIGGRAEITVSGFEPSDFLLSEDSVEITDSPYVDYSVENGKIILSGMAAGSDDVRLTIGGKSFEIYAVVNALSQFIDVRQGKTTVSNGEYITLLDELTFSVNVGRKDSIITDNSAEVVFDDEVHKVIGEIKIAIGTSPKQIVFRPSDGGANSVAINIRRVSALPDFGLSASYTNANSQVNMLKIYNSVKDAENLSFVFPKNMQGTMTLNFIMPENFLGGFGSDVESAQSAFEKAFELDTKEISNWNIEYNVSSTAIVFTPNEATNAYERSVTLRYADITKKIILRRVDVGNFEPTGYDMENKQDVYLGLQQVRLFAKHSIYDGKEVDYYKVPLSIEGNKDHVQFVLTRYEGNSAVKVITTQTGKSVICGDETYEISGSSGDYALFNKQGQANNAEISWVDIYSEPGYARIYFGAFDGLSETDVQNNYFGNFGERDDWTELTENKGDGTRSTALGANSGAFLRVQAGDGSEGGATWHYNFNVINDISDSEKIYNVIDAAGFNAAHNVVLQHRLYAPGEMAGVEAKYILGSTENPNKGSVYGNGFQLNFKAYNDANTDTVPLTFKSVYNAVIKGTVAEANANYEAFRLYVEGEYFYYCDIQCMYRGIDEHTDYRTYVKNSIIRYTFEGLYMNADNTAIYAENIVMIAVLKALNTVADNHFYFRGFVDILNYYNRSQLISALVPSVMQNSNQLAVIDDFMDEINDYSEWFGQSGGSSRDATDRYVNMALLGENEGSPDRTNFFFNEATGAYEEGLGTSVDGDGNLKKMASVSVVIATLTPWSYDYKNDIDGGKVELSIEGGKFYEYLKDAQLSLGNVTNEQVLEQIDYHEGMTDNEVYEEFKKALNDLLNDGKSGFGELYGPLIFNKYKETLTNSINTSYRDMTNVDKLFTPDRYIRLLCQFKGTDEDGNMIVNSDHQLWHMQRVYRDHSLVGENGWNFDDHIDNLKTSLAGSSWGDFTWTGEKMINTSSSPAPSLTGKAMLASLKFQFRNA